MIPTATLARLTRFGMVGGAATVTHYAVALAANLAVSAYLANAAGYVCALGVSYLGHQRLTFGLDGASVAHGRQFPRFLATSLSALALSQGVLFLLHSLQCPPNLALVGAVLTVPPVTYALSRYWVFR